MKRCVVFVLVLSFSLSPVLQSQAQYAESPKFARDREYDVLHYKLNLEIDEVARKCEGTATITLVPLRTGFDRVLLDAAELSVSEVRLHRRVMVHRQSGDTLLVDLDKPYGLRDTLSVTVAYSVTSPRKGLYFVQPDSGYPNKQFQVWTQGEPEENRYWIPCYDYPNDKATSEIIVTVREGLTAISNGKLLETKRDVKNKKVTYHWRQSLPHSSYLISLVVGEYVGIQDSWGNIPITHYVYPGRKDDAMRSFGKTPQMMEFFSNRIGYRYPWEKYGHTVVQDFMWGGMENVTISTLTDRTMHDSRAALDVSSDGLVAHELAHQWFGNLITFRDWSHAWLSEGFATYFDYLFQGHDKGPDYFSKLVYDAQRSIANSDFGPNRRPTVFNRYINPNDLFDQRIYQKGACVLHMLRSVIGDELFWKATNNFVQKFAFQCAETNDFKMAIEEATGYNLHWFFDQWLYKSGAPELRIEQTWDQASRMVTLTVRQTQARDSLTGLFRMPVDIEVWLRGVPETYRVWIEKEEETFLFPAYQQPQCVIFDKGSWLIKRATFSKPTSEWLFQLQHATDAADRLAALDELQWVADSSAVIEAVSAVAMDDRSLDVRRDAVWLLGDVKSTDVSDRLIAAYGDRSSKVRVAAINSLGRYSGDRVIKTLEHAFRRDSSYEVAATALKTLARVDTTRRQQLCIEALDRPSHNEVIRAAALQTLASVRGDEALQMVMKYTQYGIDRNLRIQAINLLGSVWRERRGALDHLITLLQDPSFHVRRAVIDNLGNIGHPAAVPLLERSIEQEPDTRIVKAARDALRKIRETIQKSSN